MLQVNYNNETGCPFGEKLIYQIARTAAQAEKKISGSIEISVVSRQTIKKINRLHLGKNRETDVLSFPLGGEGKGPRFFGEIYLCFEVIADQAKRFGIPAKEEFVRLLVHGLLHLSGYDHITGKDAEKMFKKQEQIVAKIKILP